MANEKQKTKTRIKIVLVLGLFLALFVMFNAQQFLLAAGLYIVMGIVTLNLYGQWGKIGKLSDLEGIDSNYVTDGLVGVGLGIGTIILASIIPIIGVIGLPPVQSIAGTLGRLLIIVPIASIFEEVFFRDFLMDFLNSKLNLPRIISILLTALGFSFFHLLAYGENLAAASGSFTSAALMGFIFGLVSERQNSLAGSIMYHATLNTWLGFIKLNLIIGLAYAIL